MCMCAYRQYSLGQCDFYCNQTDLPYRHPIDFSSIEIRDHFHLSRVYYALLCSINDSKI